MMPGPHGGHGPPNAMHHQGRRQEHHAQYYAHHMPPQTHSPVHHNPYAQYHHPQHYAPPYGYQHMQQMPQWNPYHQPPPQPQYAMPPRQFQPHASPVVVSSHPHIAAMPPVNRAMGQTPPIVHSRTPPVQRIQTPQPAPSTPSAHSQTQLSASTPPTNTTIDTPPPAAEKSVQAAPPSPTSYKPFFPPLPWLSAPGPFPPRAGGRKRRRRAPVDADEEGLALPSREQAVEEPTEETDEVEEGEQTPTEGPEESLASTVAVPSDIEVDTPSTSHPPSEVDLTHVTTPSAMPQPAQPAATTAKHTRNATIPAIPNIPFRPRPSSPASTTQKSVKSPPPAKAEANGVAPEQEKTDAEETPKASPPQKAAPPKSWAELLRSKNAPAPSTSTQAPAAPSTNGVVTTNGPTMPTSDTLADVLASFSVESAKKVAFLEPRGLVNTGNLCYMNSVCIEIHM